MKKYILAIYNLKYMFDKGNRIFFIVLISISLSVFGMLFYAGYFLYSYYGSVTGSQIIMALSPDPSGKEVCRLLSQLRNDDYGVQRIRLETGNQNENRVVGEYNRQWDENILVGQNYSLEEEQPYVIMAEYMVDFVENGESPIDYHIKDDEELRVYGIVPYVEGDGYSVPVNYFAMNYPVEKIRYEYAGKVERQTIRIIKELLKKSDIVESFQVIRSENPFFSVDFMEQFIQILSIFTVIIINIFCMVYSWMIHFKRNYRIYQMCGASVQSVVEIIMVQTCLLMFMGLLLGNLIFLICKILLKNTNLLFQETYFSYIGVSMVLMVVLMIFSFLLAKRVTKTDTIYNMRE